MWMHQRLNGYLFTVVNSTSALGMLKKEVLGLVVTQNNTNGRNLLFLSLSCVQMEELQMFRVAYLTKSAFSVICLIFYINLIMRQILLLKHVMV